MSVMLMRCPQVRLFCSAFLSVLVYLTVQVFTPLFCLLVFYLSQQLDT